LKPAEEAKGTTNYATDEQRWSAAMVRAQAGDNAQYQQLLTELSGVIYRYLLSRFGNQDFIEDCVQETLLAIHHARHTYQPRRRFRPWLFAIVRNKAIDMLRKRKNYIKMIASETEAAQLAAGNEAHPSSVHSLDTGISQGRLLDALAPPLKQAIVLTKFAGFSTAEAARELGISETAVKVRIHRGIARLRRLLEADEP